MKNKGFIILWLIASAMVFGVMIENIHSVSSPEDSEVKVDSIEVKNKIQKAGIIPREAKYWKEL
jgi:hypothetical protein